MKGVPLKQLADAKGFSVEQLAAFGVADAKHAGTPCVDIPYRDASGAVVRVKQRVELEGKERERFHWPRGKPTMPYGLDRLASLAADAGVVLVEGESDCWTFWVNGIAALGIPGATSWKPEYAALLTGRPVFVWQEADDAGPKFVEAVTRDLPDARVIRGTADAKDPNAVWLLARRDAVLFAGAMRALMARARTLSEEAEAVRTAEAAAALAASGELLVDPDILGRVRDYLVASGYAGDTTAPQLVFLSLTSRCLARPLNLAIVAASASGKNAAVDHALPLFPRSAYVMVQASSPRALVYSADDFEHRMVIVGEIDSVPEEGPAASAVRSIAADSAMAYDVVERDEDTGKWGVRHIVKPGPTGLITTSTRPLREQLSTRMLTISIADTAEHTRAVLHAHADRLTSGRLAPSADQFVAAQRWLELAGAREMSVPFAHPLAAAVPADLIRMRRDFRQLLSAIETVTFLRQRQRSRDARGRIVATLDDYAAARELLLDVFTASATGGVTRAVREVVQVVHDIGDAPGGVSVASIGKRVHPAAHRTTVQRRIHAAVRLGYLVNTETRRGSPMKLSVGDPLPEERDALPTAEQLSGLCRPNHPETAASVHQVPENPITTGLGTDAPPLRHMRIGASEPDAPMRADAQPLHRLPTNNDGPLVAPDAPMHPFPGGVDGAGEDAVLRAAYDSGFAAWSCYVCRGLESWVRGDGGRTCAVCHPQPGGAPMG